MSHIVEVAIAGLAGRKDVYRKKFNRDINVFFGLNGSGKTSLLRILNSAMSRNPEGLEFVPFEWAEVTIYSLFYKDTFVGRYDKKRKDHKNQPTKGQGNVDIVTDQQEIRVSLPPSQNKRGWIFGDNLPKSVTSGWKNTYLPTSRLYVSDYAYRSGMVSREMPSLTNEYNWELFFARRLEELWANYSNKMLSIVQEIQGKGLASIVLGIFGPESKKEKQPQLDHEKAYERVSAFLARQGSKGALGPKEKFQDAYSKDARLKRTISYINDVEERIEEAKASRDKLESLIRKMFSGNKEMVFSDTGIGIKTTEGDEIGLATLSSGEKHALWIFVETLLAAESSLMIDEPEISLHVDWQNGLIEAMHELNPEAQLILATHSPEIMASLPDDKIFHL